VTDIQPPAAATDTDQTAETDTQETKHPLTTDHQGTHTINGVLDFYFFINNISIQFTPNLKH
jgi:hypothetical protein